MDLNLKTFSVHSSFAAQIPLRLRRRGGGPAVLPDGADDQSQQEDRYDVAVPAANDATLSFRFFLHTFISCIPAAVVLYMIISTIIRIITQDLMFRTGVSQPEQG